MENIFKSRIYFVLIILLGLQKNNLAMGAGGGAGGHNSADASIIPDDSASDSTKILHVDYPLTLECKIQKGKEEKFNAHWKKDGNVVDLDDERVKLINNSTLVIKPAQMGDVGNYKCSSGGNHFEVHVIYLFYKKLAKSMTVLQGDTLTINCDVDGDPEPTVTWLKNSVEIEDAVNGSRFTLEANKKGTINASLAIKSAIFDDRAEYVCLINSLTIRYNTTTFVRVKDMYAALWPFLGICAEVFILCLIIFIYEKKRAKAEFEESDTDQPTDGKNKSDHNKDSVRQRK